jgi:hypothetical protein
VEEPMINDLNEMLKQIERVPLGRSEVDILFGALEREWAASVSKLTVNLHLIMIWGIMICGIMTESGNAMRIGGGYENGW